MSDTQQPATTDDHLRAIRGLLTFVAVLLVVLLLFVTVAYFDGLKVKV